MGERFHIHMRNNNLKLTDFQQLFSACTNRSKIDPWFQWACPWSNLPHVIAMEICKWYITYSNHNWFWKMDPVSWLFFHHKPRCSADNSHISAVEVEKMTYTKTFIGADLNNIATIVLVSCLCNNSHVSNRFLYKVRRIFFCHTSTCLSSIFSHNFGWFSDYFWFKMNINKSPRRFSAASLICV